MIEGWVASDFEGLIDAFAANFDERHDVGAAVCVYVDGEPVADLWGGVADATTGEPWHEDTVVPVFSSSKGVTAVVANHVIERGLLDPGAPIARYWPEFEAPVTVRQALSHQAGLPYVEGEFTLEESLAWDPVVERLAHQKPIWEPGTQHGYHMKTYGWLAGELVRRTTGKTVGAYVRDELAPPLGGLDFWIGLPEEIEPRVARLVTPKADMRAALAEFGDDFLLGKVFSNPSGLFTYDDMWNTRALHACELPSSNGIGDARSLARLYASLISDVDGVRTLQPETVAAATFEQVRGTDAVIMVEAAFGLGFMLGNTFGAANPPSAFGHAGAGGSLAFADPERNVSFAYVMNKLIFDPRGERRSAALVEAVLGTPA